MTENLTVSRLKAQFSDAISGVVEFRGDTTVTVRRDAIVAACRFLRDDPGLAYVFLVDLTAVDYSDFPDKEARFAVHYQLHSYQNNERIRLKVWVAESDPLVPTVTGLWQGANWLEREVYDLMGISFSGHPDMRRILLPADADSHPLRKDFPVFGTKEPVVRVKGFRENFDC
jgi:NADH-quinone oxidoreductase subunit C